MWVLECMGNRRGWPAKPGGSAGPEEVYWCSRNELLAEVMVDMACL
jgi:hypothetical protein